MPETTIFSVRMDKEIKDKSEKLFKELGMNLTTAINIFLRQAIQTNGFPFEIKLQRANTQPVSTKRENSEADS